MKKIIYILVIALLTSCDPGYRIYIMNKSSNDIYIETEPAIESFLAFKDVYYDSIVAKKISASSMKNLYKIRPNEKINFLGYIGKPSPDYFPYQNIKIIESYDTIKINNKNLKNKISKRNKNNYYIEVL